MTHRNKLVQSCFFQLRNISKIKVMLTTRHLELLIHTLIFSCLDYCNALFTCLNCAALSLLQLVQNAAARLLTKTNCRYHVTPVIASLHWLPVKYRIDFKTLLLTYKALHGLAPPYTAELPTPLLHCAFAVKVPSLWNSLPSSVRSSESLNVFKKLLKTHLYRLAFPTIEL